MKDDDVLYVTMPQKIDVDGVICTKRWIWAGIVEELKQDALQNRLNLTHIAEQKKSGRVVIP